MPEHSPVAKKAVANAEKIWAYKLEGLGQCTTRIWLRSFR